MRASFGYGGWVAIDDIGLPGPLYVKVRLAKDSRLQVGEIYLDASRSELSLTQRDLRELPLSRIEGLINANREHVLAHKNHELPAPDLSTFATYYVTQFVNFDKNSRNWVELAFASQVPEAYKAAGEVPIPRVKRQRAKWAVVDEDQEYRLSSKAAAGGLTDDFLRDVARAYSAALMRGERPNKSIAEQTHVEPKSAQRWVYTARQRKLMPPANKRGQAG